MDSDKRQPMHISEGHLAAAGAFFAARDVYGLAWIDESLTVSATYGAKASFIAVGCPVTDSVIPLIGLEDDMRALKLATEASLELPAVVIHTGPQTSARYNLSLLWSSENKTYYLLVARADLNGTLEIELLRQVRARLMAEAETKAKSDALERANRDLESYAAIVSHDLQAPMRALRYVAEEAAAAQKAGDWVSAEQKLDWIGAQTRRMSAMLSGLLDYSSIGRKCEAIETVDTRALAEAIARSVPAGTGMSVRVVGTWPVIETLKAPLDLVLRNLVDNAIKHHDRREGSVTLRCSETADSLLITVEDDGPGIPAQHREAIFQPFHTLATANSPADGVGMGLALVRRTLEGLGGAIRVKDPVGHGVGRCTEFDVRWPRSVKA